MQRIAWKSKISGKTGHGAWRPYDLSAIVAVANRAHPDLEHWIETK